MKSFPILVLGLAVITACEIGTPIYRANAKLLVTRAGAAVPVSDLVQENEERFVDTQIAIMLTQTMQRRVQQRMKKTADEIRGNLGNLKIARLGNTDIIEISVESRSRDFARDYANALMDEYLRFRDEQRAQAWESVLLVLTREINRIHQERKSANDRLLAYAKEHDIALTNDVWELQVMREDRDRIQRLYNALMEQLMRVDVSQGFSEYRIGVLEPATIEANPVRRTIGPMNTP